MTNCLIVAVVFLGIFSNCSKPKIEQKKINVQIDPNLEFISSILLTGKYNEMTTPYIGYGLMTEDSNQYTNAIKGFFSKYQSHEIYGFIENMIPDGFTFSRPVELMLSLNQSKDFSMRFPLSELCVQYCGGMENIASLLNQLYEFSKETNYFDFFDSIKPYYDPYLEKADTYLQTIPFIPIIEEMFGKQQNSYNCVISGLMTGNYGINFYNKENMSADIFTVFYSYSDKDIDNYFILEDTLSANIIFHELSHPFINPLTEKYWSTAEKYSSAYEWLKKYKLPDYQSGYGDWQECINEHLVRAMAVHLLNKCNKKDEANWWLENNINQGYKYIPKLLEAYDYYDSSRKKYKTFDDFYPTLLKVFENEV